MDERQTVDGQRQVPIRDITNMDFMAGGVDVPSDYHTLYWCQIFKLPDSKQVGKHHLIKVLNGVLFYATIIVRLWLDISPLSPNNCTKTF